MTINFANKQALLKLAESNNRLAVQKHRENKLNTLFLGVFIFMLIAAIIIKIKS